MVRCYTTALNIDPDIAEDIYWQQVYNICCANNIAYSQDTYVKAYSHKGMINGFPIVINIIVVKG